MKTSLLRLFTAFFLAGSLAVQPAYADGLKEGAASLLVPTLGQAMNGELCTGKARVMGGFEVSALTITAVLGLTTGGAAMLFGAVPLALNHLWSSMDAFRVARNRSEVRSIAYQYIGEQQRAMELARQQQFANEENNRSDFRERMRLAAGQPAY